MNQKHQLVSNEELEYSISTSETTSTSIADAFSLRTRIDSATSDSCSGTPRSLIGGFHAINNGSRNNADLGQRCYVTEDVKLELLEDTQDPFAFDEDEFELSKWDVLSGRHKKYQTQKGRFTCRDLKDGSQSRMIMSQQGSSNGEIRNLQEASCSIAVNDEGSSLLSNCLLTAVKVIL